MFNEYASKEGLLVSVRYFSPYCLIRKNDDAAVPFLWWRESFGFSMMMNNAPAILEQLQRLTMCVYMYYVYMYVCM